MKISAKNPFLSRFAAYPKDESEEETSRFALRLQEIMGEIGDRSFRDYETPKGVAFVFRLEADEEQPCADCGQVHGKGVHGTSDAIKSLVASLGGDTRVAVLTGSELASMMGGGALDRDDELLGDLASVFRSLPPGAREGATKAAFNRKAASMTHAQVEDLLARAQATLAKASKEATPSEGLLEYLKLIIGLCEGKQAFAMS